MNLSSLPQRWGKWSLLIPPLLSAILILSDYSTPGITMDGHTYLQIARNIHFGVGLGWQALWAAPLHSVLIALVGWLPGVAEPQVAAGIVAAVMGVGLTAAVCFLAHEAYDRRVALAAGCITAVFPHFRWIARTTEPEVTYAAFLVLALALLLATLRRKSLRLAAATGISFSLAYLGRSEGFLIMLLVLGACVAVSVLQEHRLSAVRLVVVVILFFFAASLPYLIFLKRNYGTWMISPKATYVLIWMKSRIYHDNDKGEIGNDELWGLNRNGRLKWQEPSGFSDLAAYLMSHPAKSRQVYLHNLSLELPGRIPNNSGMLHYPQVYPVILVLFGLFAAFRRWGDDSARTKAVLFSPLLILLILPVYTEGWWKYLVPYAPLVIIAGCIGLVQVNDLLNRRLSRFAVLFSVAATCLTLWYWQAITPPRQAEAPVSAVDQGRRSYAVEAEKAGRWITNTLGPGKNYMVRWSKLIYFLNGLWTAEPVADYFSLLQYAHREGAEYYLREVPPDVPLSELATTVPPGLAFATLYRSPDTGFSVAVYRFTALPQTGVNQ